MYFQCADGSSGNSEPTTREVSPDIHSTGCEPHEVEATTEYDIGKIIESNLSLHDISRDMKAYMILVGI